MKPSGLRSYDRLRNHVLPRWGSPGLARSATPRFNRGLQGLSQNIGPSLIANTYSVLARILDDAVVTGSG